jgi:hypothetical protein
MVSEISLCFVYPSSAPGSAKLNAVAIFVGTFGYDFVFADREPTAEEVASLENTTILFFLDLFQDNFGDDTVDGVDGAVLSSQFGDQPPRQFTMDIAATVLFSGCAPSQEDLDSVIVLSDGQLQDYLDRYVYLMEPIGGHIFMLVSRVEFSGSIATV